MLQLLDGALGGLVPLFAEYGLPEADLRAGLDALRLGAAEAALQAARASGEGIPLSEAALDAERFPILARLHVSVSDILTLPLPTEVVVPFRRLLARERPPIVEAVRLELARLACNPNSSLPEQALARFCLFEAVRLNVIVATWDSRAELTMAELDDEAVSALAEVEVLQLVAQASALDGPAPIRPLEVLVAAALLRVDWHMEKAVAALAGVSRILLEVEARRAWFEAQLQEMSAEDAVLIRNQVAPALGEQRLSIERLSVRHPLLFQDVPRNTLDKRLERRRRSLEQGDLAPMRRRGVALIDLLREAHEAAP